MCLEAYSPEGEISIPYEHEFVLFRTRSLISASYSFLVRNNTGKPLSSIFLLYPKPLFHLVQDGKVRLRGVVDMLSEFEKRLSAGSRAVLPGVLDGRFFQATISNPNRPQELLEGTRGLLDSSSVSIARISDFQSHHADLVTLHKFSAIQVSFGNDLPPGESQWLSFQITFNDPGNSLVDGRTLHEFAAPLRVRNTLIEIFESAIADLNSGLDSEANVAIDEWWNKTDHYEEVLSILGLDNRESRKVDLQYHHLCFAADPRSCRIEMIQKDGDVVSLANSPRRRNVAIANERIEADVYEYKSGTLLRPLNPGGSFGLKVFLAAGQ
jgi:hypothetical protein